MTRDDLQRHLNSFPGARKVQIEGDARFVVSIEATGFDSDDDAERQAQIWRFLRDAYTEEELNAIEVVFAAAPDDPRESKPV